MVVNEIVDYVDLDTITIRPPKSDQIYQATEDRIIDLIHTKLSVSFDWDNSYLEGDAELTLSPYYYPLDTLEIDAKGFDIKEVAILDSLDQRDELRFDYDQRTLKIALETSIKKNDTIRIKIRYTAKPNELEKGGSEAITSDIGLYFINPKGEEANKPKQIWTQGETEASSCWFPTIDVPNEKMTQEVIITVDSIYTTLSNGELLYQIENADGTRTDYWEQKLPHAPYLCMMAIGEYAVVKDEWNDKPVNYYVEEEFKENARDIFPNTVEMLSFFSDKLQYPYPWFKYDQVVVRDYVSGAMENTSAVIYGEFVQGDARYLIDNQGEDIVAHELFHHWFGDLVTCESWSNLPLNEAFATYGEYLWMEHKYGKDAADYHLYKDELAYKQEARIERKKLIRFDYEDKEDMFDAHSYQKGGRVLHMLRAELGESAFFEGLTNYLKKHAYGTAEIHDLRMAFEEVCGKDLNWFFNQWFLKAGHPVLEISHEYDSLSNDLIIHVEQSQKGTDIPEAFELRTSIETKTLGQTKRFPIHLTKKKQSFKFKLASTPDYVQIDPDNILLIERVDAYSLSMAKELYHEKNDFMDRYNAVNIASERADEIAFAILDNALNDSHWKIRQKAIQGSEKLAAFKGDIREKIIALTNDKKSNVRAEALDALAFYFEDVKDTSIIQPFLKDSSYLVVSYALEALYFLNQESALKMAKELEKLNSSDVLTSIAYIYADDGDISYSTFFKETLNKMDDYSIYDFISSYGSYAVFQSNEKLLSEAIKDFKSVSLSNKKWWVRMSAVNAIIGIHDNLSPENMALNAETTDALKALKAIETEGTVLKMIENALND